MHGKIIRQFPFLKKKKSLKGRIVEFSAASEIGSVRKTNQDNVFAMCPVVTCDRMEHYSVSNRKQMPVLFAVCDGMGGGRYGEQASYIASQMIEQVDVYKIAEKADDWLESFFIDLYQRMNDAIFEQYGHMGVLVGCTATLLYMDDQRICFVNAGDSPGMCCTDSGLQIITQADNRANQLYLMGHISEQERWNHPTKNQLTQYLGMDPEEVRLSPHIFRMEHMDESAFYVIGSDGLLDKTDLREIENCLRSSPIHEAARECVNYALEAGSRDNITAIVVQVEAKENDS